MALLVAQTRLSARHLESSAGGLEPTGSAMAGALDPIALSPEERASGRESLHPDSLNASVRHSEGTADPENSTAAELYPEEASLEDAAFAPDRKPTRQSCGQDHAPLERTFAATISPNQV